MARLSHVNEAFLLHVYRLSSHVCHEMLQIESFPVALYMVQLSGKENLNVSNRCLAQLAFQRKLYLPVRLSFQALPFFIDLHGLLFICVYVTE